jgi:hypothetical protein
LTGVAEVVVLDIVETLRRSYHHRSHAVHTSPSICQPLCRRRKFPGNFRFDSGGRLDFDYIKFSLNFGFDFGVKFRQ